MTISKNPQIIHDMFNQIAGKYDINNNLISLGMHKFVKFSPGFPLVEAALILYSLHHFSSKGALMSYPHRLDLPLFLRNISRSAIPPVSPARPLS